MAQDKRVFTGGMDKDSDPRLIKKNDYRDAKNIRNVASSDGTAGSVENIEGTLKVPFDLKGVDQNVITFNDEGGFVTDVDSSEVFYGQVITISGTEQFHHHYNFTILNYLDNNGNLASEGINLSWVGNNAGSATTEYLHSIFNTNNGELNDNITIVNISPNNPGALSTAHISNINFNNGTPLMDGGS